MKSVKLTISSHQVYSDIVVCHDVCVMHSREGSGLLCLRGVPVGEVRGELARNSRALAPSRSPMVDPESLYPLSFSEDVDCVAFVSSSTSSSSSSPES